VCEAQYIKRKNSMTGQVYRQRAYKTQYIAIYHFVS